MPTTSSNSTKILSDDFSTNGRLDAATWSFPTGDASFIEPQTQMRPELPSASDGMLHLLLNTYNPNATNGASLYGTDAFTKQTFNVYDGELTFEASVKLDQTQGGIIGGFFLYNFRADQTHDEIDFEDVSNNINGVQTNLYANQPLGIGNPTSVALAKPLTDLHTFKIDWQINQIQWFVDGTVVRTASLSTPLAPMALHFNIWGPDRGTPSSTLVQGQDQQFGFDVDSLTVTRIVNTSGYSGASKNYAVTVASATGGLNVLDKVGLDGTNDLTNVQRLQFADQTIDTTVFTKTASLSTTQLTELVDLYVAYFNRAPDATGLDFWGGTLKDGASFATLAAGFAGSAEAVAAYPPTLSNSDFVTTVYNNVLGRNTDQAGFNFWVSQLDSGKVTKGNFVLNVVESVLQQSGTADAQYIGNKYTVGAHFALTEGLSDGTWAKTVMSGVNNTAASVTTANAQTDAFAATAATSAGSEFVVKIVGVAV